MTYQELRQKYSKFLYKNFSHEVVDNNLVLKFVYQTPPDLDFVHTVTFVNLKNIGNIDALVFNIGLAEMFSYWKATCSQVVEIQAGFLDPDQIAFWHKLFIKGMGEYYFKNQIDFTANNFVTITTSSITPFNPPLNLSGGNSVLLPVGGGKDSIVTLEILKKHFKVIPLMINPTPAMGKIAPDAIVVKRLIDPRLLELKYLNGHIPLSASIALIAVLSAQMSDCKYVALSNERSSDEGNTTYLGHQINHQYSKSLEFETDLNKYLKKITTVKYFSFLRPLYELQITKLFTRYPQYFNIFTSCNKNFKIDHKQRPIGGLWCKTCPKCVSIALLLGKEKSLIIMGAYPPDMPENKNIMDGLLGITPIKPFECVLTRAEALGTIDLNSWLDNPNMPSQFALILQLAQAKKVLILGYGREGQSTHKFLSQKFPHLQIDTADRKDDPDYLTKIANYQIIFKTPGISPHLPEIAAAKKNKKLITSQTQIFFELCPGKIIGVTGTKGKSTTASLIYHVLSQNGIPSVLVGNIGKPMLDYLPEITPNTWVVAELSSYQLMDLEKSPHIAVLQAIYPDHLDYHESFEEYKNAKLNIAKYQKPGDYFIHDLLLPDKPIESQLLGKHNQLNILPSIEIGKILKIPKAKILAAIQTFRPLETRLENCGTRQGITFYADTLATIPEATIAAIDALNPQTLIAGGHDRHQDYTTLGKKINASNIKTLILFPDTGERIKQAISRKTIRCFSANSMQEAVNFAFQYTENGKICLLSPAAPSFTLFKDYRDEAEQYKKSIKDLSKV